jgi:hypothetical protein
LITSITAFLFGLTCVLAYNFIEDIIYNGKVLTELDATSRTLETNISNSKTLKNNIGDLNKNTTLSNLRVDQKDQPMNVVIDSMPSLDDRPSLASSLQKVILAKHGASIYSIGVNTSSASTNLATSKTTANYLPITFDFTLVGSQDAIKATIIDIENTIRPIMITNLILTANGDAEMRAAVTATTYYSPLTNYAMTDKVIERTEK